MALADTPGLDEYRFWVSLEPETSAAVGGGYLQEHAHTVACLLSERGWRCFVPDDFGNAGEKNEGTIYSV